MAKKLETNKQFEIIKSEIKSFDDRIAFIRGLIHQNDVFMERYLPITMLSDVHDVMSEAILDYNDRKHYLETVKGKFTKMQEKIMDAEGIDRTNNPHMVKSKLYCTLVKDSYKIPEIELLPTLSSSTEEEEEPAAEQVV